MRYFRKMRSARKSHAINIRNPRLFFRGSVPREFFRVPGDGLLFVIAFYERAGSVRPGESLLRTAGKKFVTSVVLSFSCFYLICACMRITGSYGPT